MKVEKKKREEEIKLSTESSDSNDKIWDLDFDLGKLNLKTYIWV